MSRSVRSRFLHGLARAFAVIGLASTSALIIAPEIAGALAVTGSSFSINDPGSLSGSSGQAITPVQFTASNIDV
ncbi:MAG: hypothetical protein WCI12_09490, partial [Actinomycetes bacterium]